MHGALHRIVAACALATVPVFSTAACERPPKLPKPSKAFCDAAKRYEDRITGEKNASLDEQVRLVEQIDAHAPEDIRSDARTFVDSMRRLAAGDETVKGDEKIQKAVDNVNRRYSNGCGVFARKGPL